MRVLAILFFLVGEYLQATEVDNFTRHLDYPKLIDASKALNELTNQLLQEAEKSANEAPGCDEAKLYEAVVDKLGTNPWARIEHMIVKSKSFDKFSFPRSQSVYRRVSFFDGPALFLADLGQIIRIGDTSIGTDKVGHFVQQGYEYFDMVYLQNDLYLPKLKDKDGKIQHLVNWANTVANVLVHGAKEVAARLPGFGLNTELDAVKAKELELIGEAMDYGSRLERSYYGLETTGVYSYADLVANLQGMHWWVRLTGLRGYANGPPYFTCSNKQWKFGHSMDWENYVTPLWNEAINCSKYSNAKFEERIQYALAALEIKYGKNFKCPLIKAPCSFLENFPFHDKLSMLTCKGGVLE